MFKRFLDQLRKWLIKDSLTNVNYNQPKQIDGKNNICYVYEISEDTEVEILDDLKAIKSQVIYDIYWQNTDDTSVLTFTYNDESLSVGGDTQDPTAQNHVIFMRSPKGSTTLTALLEISNTASLAKTIPIKPGYTPPEIVWNIVDDVTFDINASPFTPTSGATVSGGNLTVISAGSGTNGILNSNYLLPNRNYRVTLFNLDITDDNPKIITSSLNLVTESLAIEVIGSGEVSFEFTTPASDSSQMNYGYLGSSAARTGTTVISRMLIEIQEV